MKRPTDDELLDFVASNYADYDEAKAREALAREPEAFRAQLLAAMWIDGWKSALSSMRRTTGCRTTTTRSRTA